jgi:hypothetical protein
MVACCLMVQRRPAAPWPRLLISSCTESSALTDPALLSSARSCLIAATAEVTRLFTSATCWVTSCACWPKEIRLPSWAVSLVSVVVYAGTGILSSRLTSGTWCLPGGMVSCWLET